MDFILWIIAISTFGWLANNWIRAKHGYDLEDEWGGKTPTAARNANVALAARVEKLAEEVEVYRNRVRVLERIVTDSGYQLDHEIDRLRDREGELQ